MLCHWTQAHENNNVLASAPPHSFGHHDVCFNSIFFKFFSLCVQLEYHSVIPFKCDTNFLKQYLLTSSIG